nr:MAG TPA: Mor transcription activator family [Caudoviricetes sp.]
MIFLNEELNRVVPVDTLTHKLGVSSNTIYTILRG